MACPCSALVSGISRLNGVTELKTTAQDQMDRLAASMNINTRDPAAIRQRVEIDRHDFQLRCCGNVCRRHRLGADDHAVRLLQIGLIGLFADLLDMGLAHARRGVQKRKSRRMQLSGNKDMRHQ